MQFKCWLVCRLMRSPKLNPNLGVGDKWSRGVPSPQPVSPPWRYSKFSQNPTTPYHESIPMKGEKTR